MKLRNEFTDEVRAVYAFEVSCQYPYCEVKRHNKARLGSNQSLELHHIIGRVSNSILNSIMVCRECHKTLHGLSFKKKAELLQQQIRWLVKINYEFTEKDIIFYEEYKQYYKTKIL